MDLRKFTLSLLFSSLFMFCLNAQDTLIVKGLINSNRGNPIQVNIEIDNNSVHSQNSSVFTDTSGHYIDTFIVNRAQGSVFVWIVDCNRDTVSKHDGYYTANLIITVDLDYCPTAAHPCTALFTKVQALNARRQPIPFLIHIIDKSSGSNLTYSWDFGDGHSSTHPSPTHTYAGHGPYILCLTVSNANCTDTFCDTISIDSSGNLKSGQGFTIVVGGNIPTGISQNMSQSVELELFPNPAVDQISLNYNSTTSGIAKISIRDAFGRLLLIKKKSISSGDQTIDLDIDILNSGFYILQFEIDNNVQSINFIKK